MEDLFGAIVPILVALGWLFGMFKKDDKDQPTKRPQPRPTPVPSGPNHTGHTESSTISDDHEEQRNSSQQTYFEQKQEQLKKLRSNLEADISNDSGKIERISSIHNQRNENKKRDSSKTQKNSRLSVTNNLTKRGLAESVVMAEILGPPKAIKPYRNVVQNRRN